MGLRPSFLLSVTLLALAACGQPPAEPVAEPSAASHSTPPVLFIEVTEPDHPDPVVRSGAAGPLIDCEHGPLLGSTASNFGGPPGEPTPEQALEAFTGQGLFQVPREGYRQVARSDDRVLFLYEAGERVRVAVIVAQAGVSDQIMHADGWAVETFAMCDPSEFGQSPEHPAMAGVWHDAAGEPVPTGTVYSHTGPAHCDWESVTFLTVEDEPFVRDPDGLLADYTVTSFDPSARLPDDAADTGYRKDGAALWRAADGSAVYLVSSAAVERWAATRELITCA